MKKISKTEAKKKIDLFFKEIKTKNSKEINKIKKLAMSKNIPLKDKKKLFCKKCLIPYNNSKIRIKDKTKSVICNNCDYICRWKI